MRGSISPRPLPYQQIIDFTFNLATYTQKNEIFLIIKFFLKTIHLVIGNQGYRFLNYFDYCVNSSFFNNVNSNSETGPPSSEGPWSLPKICLKQTAFNSAVVQEFFARSFPLHTWVTLILWKISLFQSTQKPKTVAVISFLWVFFYNIISNSVLVKTEEDHLHI